MTTKLSVNGVDHGAISIEPLAARLAQVANHERAEIWLESDAGPRLCVLKSGGVAFLMFLREKGDAGMSSRGAESSGGSATEFTLSNGQADEYPTGWCVPFDAARRAAEYFWFHRAPAPFIDWHDDG